SLDGKWLAAGMATGAVTLVELSTGHLLSIPGHRDEVLKVLFSPDGQLLASTGADGLVKLWETGTWRGAGTLTGPTEAVNGVAFTADSRWILAGSDDGSMMIWSSPSGELAATVVSARGSDDWLVVTPDGLFDGSPAAWELILWRFEHDTFKTAT